MMTSPQRSPTTALPLGRPSILDGRRATSQNDLLRLTRGWFREQGYFAAAARLRDVAPDPLPADCGTALARTLGVRVGSDPELMIRALVAASVELPSLAGRRALREALDEVLESLFP